MRGLGHVHIMRAWLHLWFSLFYFILSHWILYMTVKLKVPCCVCICWFSWSTDYWKGLKIFVACITDTHGYTHIYMGIYFETICISISWHALILRPKGYYIVNSCSIDYLPFILKWILAIFCILKWILAIYINITI